MFHCICKKFLHCSSNGYTLISHNPSSMVVSSSLIIRYFSSDSSDNPLSFTLTYLTNTCGLSPKSALSASKIVQFECSKKADSVLSFFQELEFSMLQISEIIRKLPRILHSDPKNTITPKLEFFRSLGLTTPEIVRIFTENPKILHRNLENHLVCNFNFFIELFESKYAAIDLIKRRPLVLNQNLEGSLVPNIITLRENGVPTSTILRAISIHWRGLGINPVKFRKTVEEVKEMGFNPLKLEFVKAVMVLTQISKSKRDEKIALYKRWGWSDKDIVTAFKKFPSCMAFSEDKIMAAMDFYVNELELDHSVIVRCPALLGYSLQKRLIPRGAVIQFLSSKGFVELTPNVITLFTCSEMRFLEKYVKRYEEAPHILKLYNQKLNLSYTREYGKEEE